MGRKYCQLSIEERRTIFRMLEAKRPISAIAKALGRHHSTIYREKQRNRFYDKDPETNYDGYYPVVAQDMARSRRQRLRKLYRHTNLRQHVLAHLEKGWSPEQIAGRMKRDGVAASVCAETIYQYVYSKDGQAAELYQHLEKGRKRRRRRYGRKPRGFVVPNANIIHNRPSEIGERASYGHWECDLMAFRKEFGTANVTSLVERKSRYVFVMKNPSRHSKGVFEKVIEKLKSLPSTLRKSVTFDRGTEFAFYDLLKDALGVHSYFCDPQAPYQKGAVENTNNRLRRYLPRDTDISDITDQEIEKICKRLNSTPRKCLDYLTPKECLSRQMSR